MNSIRQRLLFWQISALLVTAVLISFLTYELAWRGFRQVRDYGLEQIAYSVLRHGTQLRAPVPRPVPAPPPATAAADAPEAPDEAPATDDDDGLSDLGQFVSQIWRANGELVYSSLEAVGPPLQTDGFHRVRWNGEEWRVYALSGKGQVVQVAVTSADRASSFAELVPWLLVPLVLLVLLLGLLIHTAVASALAPLERLRQDIGLRRVEELHAVDTQELPDELQPLATTLNQLLARVETLLKGQRLFLADVAHELNTPLAAVKLQAQLARRVSEQDQHRALDELDQGIERATHLVAQLLQIARLEPDARTRQPEPLRLDQLATRVVAAFSAQADARDIDLGLEPSEPATVLADPTDLRVLLDNLIDNALRHTPSGSRVDVHVQAPPGRAVLTVQDNGPGIPPAERERVLERFVRLNPQDATGSGLGLAIVAQIVQQHQGRLSLAAGPGGGLRVQVELPLAP